MIFQRVVTAETQGFRVTPERPEGFFKYLEARPTTEIGKQIGALPSQECSVENDAICCNGTLTACLWRGNSVVVVPTFSY
jgi:hypothetical protein